MTPAEKKQKLAHLNGFDERKHIILSVREFSPGDPVMLLASKHLYASLNILGMWTGRYRQYAKHGWKSDINGSLSFAWEQRVRKHFNTSTKKRVIGLVKFIFVCETTKLFKTSKGYETVSIIYSPMDFKAFAVPSNALRVCPITKRMF